MKRREFFRLSATLPIATVAASMPQRIGIIKPIVHLPIDSDLTVGSFQWAASFAGWVEPPTAYRLRVHPQFAPYAETILRALFDREWRTRTHFVLDESLTTIDEWYLEGSKAIVYSAGA